MEIEELAIPKEEAEELAAKTEKLLALYAKQFNAKAIAWTEFGLATASIVGPRVVLGVRTVARRGQSKQAEVIDIRATPQRRETVEDRSTLSPSQLWPMGGGEDEPQ